MSEQSSNCPFEFDGANVDWFGFLDEHSYGENHDFQEHSTQAYDNIHAENCAESIGPGSPGAVDSTLDMSHVQLQVDHTGWNDDDQFRNGESFLSDQANNDHLDPSNNQLMGQNQIDAQDHSSMEENQVVLDSTTEPSEQNENGGYDEALQIEDLEEPVQSTNRLALEQQSNQVPLHVQDFQSRESPTEKSREIENESKMSLQKSTIFVEGLIEAIEPVATERQSSKRLRSIVNKDGKRLEQDIACLNDRLRLFAYHYMKNYNLQAPLNGEGGYSFTLDALLSSIAQLPSRKMEDFSKSCNLTHLVQNPITLDSYSKAVTQRFRYLCPNLSQENLSKALCNIIENGPVGQTIGDHLRGQLDVATHAEFLPTNHITPATLPDDCLFIGSTNFFIKPGKLTQPLLNYVTSCFFGHESSKMLRFPEGFPISKNCGHPHTLFICLSSSGILVSSELIKLSKGDEGAKSKDPDPKDLMQKFVDNIHSRERTSKIVYIDPDCSEYAEVEERLQSKGFNARRFDFNNLARLFGSMKMKITQKEFNQESRNSQRDGPDMRPLFKNEILSLISEGGEQSRKLNEEYKDLLGNNYQHPAKHLPEYMKELSEIKYVLSFTEAEIEEISKGHSPKYWIPQPSTHQSPGAASTPPKKQQRRQQGSAKKSKTVVDSSKVVTVTSS